MFNFAYGVSVPLCGPIAGQRHCGEAGWPPTLRPCLDPMTTTRCSPRARRGACQRGGMSRSVRRGRAGRDGAALDRGFGGGCHRGHGDDPGPGAPGGITTGAALERGGQWAGPVLAIALLGVLLLCWWRAHGWTGRLASATGTNHRTLLVAHVRRTAALARYTLAALVLTFAGALAGLIGLVLTLREISNQTAVTWPSYLSSAAAAAGVLVALLAGLFAATRLRQSVWSAYELVALGEPDTAPTSDDSDP